MESPTGIALTRRVALERRVALSEELAVERAFLVTERERISARFRASDYSGAFDALANVRAAADHIERLEHELEEAA